MELIDKRALMYQLYKQSQIDSQPRAIRRARRIVDAEPVRYGRWIGPESLKYKSDIECSVCGEVFNILSNETKRFNYCPHCGAKMDGEQWMK